jgi:SAM-dependent methyltransferase
VKCPDPEDPELMRAQIVAYDPDGDEWDLRYRSPLIVIDGEEVQRDVGYREMAVFQGRTDSQPCLYVGSMSATGSRILRSEDGVRFQSVGTMAGPTVRSLTVFKGKLFTTIVGQSGQHANESDHREVWGTDDPASGKWFPASTGGFGESANTSLFQLCAFDGHLYASTMNPLGGFQLWKSDMEGEAPYRWHKVLSAGAFRGFLNEMALSLCAFGGCLYVGTGIAGGGYDRVRKIGPAPSELLRVHPDDSWDLVVGAPRITPAGVKAPLSGLGPGFNNVMNGYTWRMCAHDEHLYVGTFNGAAFLKYRPHQLEGHDKEGMELFMKLLGAKDLEAFAERFGGCHLWRTANGTDFEPVTRNGFDNQYNMGIRQMKSTPRGLFVGTANPFAPLVAVRVGENWEYQENPAGGMEVWRGRSQANTTPRIAVETQADSERFEVALVRTARQIEYQLVPVILDDVYGDSGFCHVGLWRNSPATALESCEALVDELVEMLGEGRGPILDVSCGLGATTARLQQQLPSEKVIGVDESRWAVDRAISKYPSISFECSDPTALGLSKGSIGSVLCVEGGLFLHSRRRFLREAARVLRPGGRIILADMMLSKDALAFNPRRFKENYLENIAEYCSMIVDAGFSPNPRVIDVTEHTVGPYMRHLSGLLGALYRDKAISEGKYSAGMAIASRKSLLVGNYLIVEAETPIV